MLSDSKQLIMNEFAHSDEFLIGKDNVAVKPDRQDIP
jgi:hypothetical protein